MLQWEQYVLPSREEKKIIDNMWSAKQTFVYYENTKAEPSEVFLRCLVCLISAAGQSLHCAGGC